MSNLKAEGGVLRATITVKRAATGETETYEIAGACSPEQAAALIGKHHGASGAMVGQGAKLTNEEQ